MAGFFSSSTTRKVWPSVSVPSLFSKTARTIWLSVRESAVTSMKSRVPFSL